MGQGQEGEAERQEAREEAVVRVQGERWGLSQDLGLGTGLGSGGLGVEGELGPHSG